MGRLTYKEISKQKFKDQRNVVISKVYNVENKFIGYSVAEQFVGEESGKEIKVFLRGGLGILSNEGLLQLKEAVDRALENEGLLKQTVDKTEEM